MTACNLMPNNAADGITTGDSVQCRIYHAGVAGNPPTNAAVHCPHAGKNGAGQCGGTAPTSTSAAATTGKPATTAAAAATTGGKASDSSRLTIALLLMIAAVAVALL